MRYRNVEGVRMTEQTDREHHHGNGNKKEHAHVARGVEGEGGGFKLDEAKIRAKGKV